jgi:DNA-binding transcriptional MocR family regulator
MNSGATAERVYDALKRRIMDHEVRPGERLDPSSLADTLASSATPVRDALHVLTGEGLVETRSGDGFRVAQIDEPGLQDLYQWHGDVVALAIRGWPSTRSAWAPMRIGSETESLSHADIAARLFGRIAERSVNAEHGRTLGLLGARLHAARTVEALFFEDLDQELAALDRASQVDDRQGLRRLSSTYHRRRHRVAAEVVRALYRTA